MDKRISKNITLRGFAGLIGISPVYLCNIEKNRRAAPSEEVLDKIAEILTLTQQETEEMLDLAAKSKNIPMVALDLPEYINERDIVRVALRTAKDVDATDEEWIEFIERLQKRVNTNVVL
jgi:transcriptional regulator with XRE-family HTH domain